MRYIKDCRNCGKLINTTAHNKIYCSKPCWRTSNNKCIDCNKSIERRSTRCKSCGAKGRLNSMYKEGCKKTVRGYKKILIPTHPYCDAHNYMMEHRLIVEKYLGRYLTREEVVHHVNEILDDNRIENLMLFQNNSIHASFHFNALYYLSNTKINPKNLENYIMWFENKYKTKIISFTKEIKRLF